MTTALDKAASSLAGVYGVIALTGGIMGFVKADSIASLVAGGVSGLLLLLCAVGVFYRPTVSLGVAAVVAIALIGRFAPSALNPSSDAAKATANTVALVMSIGGVLVLLMAGFALAVRAKRSGCC